MTRKHKQLNDIVTFRQEMEHKKSYLTTCMKQYPELVDRKENLRALHNLTLRELKLRIQTQIEDIKCERAAKLIQTKWREFKIMRVIQAKFQTKVQAVVKIQRAFRHSRWTRLMNRLLKCRMHSKAEKLQKFMRGYLARKKMYQHVNLGLVDANFEYFRSMR